MTTPDVTTPEKNPRKKPAPGPDSSYGASETDRTRSDSQNASAPPSSPRPYRASDRHVAVREANRVELAEDYVEAIADLLLRGDQARVRDLAKCFGVSHVTVSRTVERLQRDGLVTTAPYRSIELTANGRAMAAASRARHAAVLRFLLSLGLPLPTAEMDAEGIEHHVGPDSLAAFQRFVDRTGPGAAPLPAPGRMEPVGPAEPPPGQPASRFERVRAAHAIELVEDYVEAIGDLIHDKGEARVVDLARHFGVSHVTVSRTLGRLQRDGYVETAPYRPVHLTSKGHQLASRARERHGIVLAFLSWLGVPPRMAEIDAEGVEHHVSLLTLQVFAKLCGCPAPDDDRP